MPTNVGYEYVEAEREYFDAKTDEQKIAALENMLATVPKHKGTEALQNQLKQRIAKLKKSSEKAKKTGRGKSLAIRKEGAAQVVLVGLPNSGKSTVLSELSGEKVEIADYPFTTKEPEVRMIPYENIWLQGIEIPAIYEGFAENPKSGVLINLIRSADFIMLVVDGSNKPQEALDSLIKELGKARIKLDKTIVVYTRQIAHLKIKFDQFYYLNKEQIAGTIWSRMGKIRVQTKSHGKTAEKPVILRKGATVKDLAETIHKDFLRKFKHAKIWGVSSRFSNGQVVGLNHILRDGDRVEIFLK